MTDTTDAEIGERSTMADTRESETGENTNRSALDRFLYEEESAFMEEFNAELDERMDKLDSSLDERGSVVDPVTRFGMGSMILLIALFFILVLISWYNGPVG
jgi:hypothetical protein